MVPLIQFKVWKEDLKVQTLLIYKNLQKNTHKYTFFAVVARTHIFRTLQFNFKTDQFGPVTNEKQGLYLNCVRIRCTYTRAFYMR